MLDIIFASRVYDLGYIFNWGGVGNMVTNLYKGKNTAYASTYAGLESAAIAEMQKTVDEFAKIK